MEVDSLKDVLASQLAELRDAETQLVRALPRMAAMASGGRFRRLLVRDLEATRLHRERIDAAIRLLEVETELVVCDVPCVTMRTLIECSEACAEIAPEDRRDSADAELISIVRHIHQLQVAEYDAAATLAGTLYFANIARLLGTTLGEEAASAERLLRLGYILAW